MVLVEKWRDKNRALKDAKHELDILAFGLYASRAELEQAKRDIARVRQWLEEMEIKKKRIEKRVLY